MCNFTTTVYKLYYSNGIISFIKINKKKRLHIVKRWYIILNRYRYNVLAKYKLQNFDNSDAVY